MEIRETGEFRARRSESGDAGRISSETPRDAEPTQNGRGTDAERLGRY